MKNLEDIIKSMKYLGFDVFEDDSKPFNINLLGVRSSDMTPNTFNDELHVFWKFRGKWSHLVFAFTTDPGLYWLMNPMNPNGTIILKSPQQVKGAFKNGKHKNQTALEQVKPFEYWRDNDRDKLFDIGGDIYYEDASTNLHSSGQNSFSVNKWSAGCQVTASDHDYDLLTYIRLEAEKHWGNSFTYTIINEEHII